MRENFKGLFSLFFLLLFSLSSQAKLHPKVDSMRNALPQSEGLERLEILFYLGRTTIHHDNEQANKYLDEAIEVMESIDTLSEAKRQKTYGGVQSVKQWGRFELNDFYGAFKGTLRLDSIAKNLEAIGEEERAIKYYADNGTLRGAIFSTQKQYNKARKEFEKTLNYFLGLNDTVRICWGLQNLGYNLLLSDSAELALPYFEKTDSLMRAATQKPWNITQNNFGLGKTYVKLEEWDRVASIMKENIELCEKHEIPRLSLSQVYYGRALLGQGKLDAAYKMVLKGKSALEQRDMPEDLTLALKYLALIEEERGNSNAALKYQKEAEELEDQNQDKKFSEELLALQTEYFNLQNPPTDSNWWFLLIPVGLFAGILIWYLRKPKVIEHQPLEIAWKNEEEETEIDDPFLKRFINKIQENIENENLSVEGIAADFKLSRVQLFKKIKASTGSSPSQLIRKIRLETAERLLIENNTTVSEVAYKVGFTNPNSFSRSFKDHFGRSPSDYLSKSG